MKERSESNNNERAPRVPKGELSQLSEPGRPSLYKPETVERLLAALKDGLSQKQASVACGVSESTFYEWRKEHPELEEKLNEAREQARQTALKAIKTAGERDWKAHEAWLRLSFQSDYRQPNTRVDIRTASQARDVQLVCTEEERRAMIAARAKFLEDAPKAPPLPDQPKMLPGHIGATQVQGNEGQTNTEQTTVQPGQAFAPYWEPHGVDVAAAEAELYGWVAKK